MENYREEWVNKQTHSNSVKFYCYKLHGSVLILSSYKSLEDTHDIMH